jgi:hypothetical protein
MIRKDYEMKENQELKIDHPSTSRFNEDEILNRFKVISHDIGDKVISLSEDVLLTCDSWSNPNSNIRKVEEAIHDQRKKHLVFYDMWQESVVEGILSLFSKHRNRYWSSIEFRGCQEKHINAILKTALELDIVQTVAFSLTNDRYDPKRICKNSTFDIISRSTKNNERFECLIFHSRPINFIRYESLKMLKVKRLHFLEGIQLHPDEIPELAAGLKENHSLVSFSFLGGIQASNGHNIGDIVEALKSHPSLKRLILCLKSAAEGGGTNLSDLLKCNDSALESLTLTGGFALKSFFDQSTFSEGLNGSKLKHLHLKDMYLFAADVQDMAVGLRKNISLESLSVKLDASCERVDVASIAWALKDNDRIQRLALTGKCSLGQGVHGIANLLSNKQSKLRDLHLSEAFYDKAKRHDGFIHVLLDGIRNNQRLESLDLSLNALSDEEVTMIYNTISTCGSLHNLDLGMNDITSHIVGSFAEVQNPNQLRVLRISSQKFSFFEINDRVCRRLANLLHLNPKLGDVNFNMGPVEWHHSYAQDGTMKWHHFFPSYLTYGLHFNNKRVNYLKAKELTKTGRQTLEHVQYMLDYNWTGRSLVTRQPDTDIPPPSEPAIPLALWPRILGRVWKGRTCFWTGRQQGTKLESAHSVTFSILREHLVEGLISGRSNATTTSMSRSAKRPRREQCCANVGNDGKKPKLKKPGCGHVGS